MKKRISGTHEWSESTKNIFSGCGNDCLYCYAKEMAIRYKRKTSDNWVEEELNKKVFNAGIGKRKGIVMYPSTHDIRPENLTFHISYIRKLLVAGNKLLIVSKPWADSIGPICDAFEDYRDQILFRFTIGSIHNNILKFWEPHAPSFEERIMSLIYAWSEGFKTSVSAEPMLDTEPRLIVNAVEDWVTDAIWFGKMNRGENRLKKNGHDNPQVLKIFEDLKTWQDDAGNIMKLYEEFKDNPKVKWKESIKEVVGIESPATKGLDI